MFYGVAYYPEHWDESQWETDARNIVAAGMDGVRIGEFAWTKMEPHEGQFDFVWLDKAIEILGSAGLKIILCTPTATPPSWLIHQHPEILPVDAHGAQMKNGVRKYYCHTNALYRDYCQRIAHAMAERYGENPHVVGWQIDNEPGDHDTVHCYCSRCRSGFIAWCRERYPSLDVLNQAWGTVFWNQTYTDWEEIDLPYPIREIGLNPGHLLDYYRFASDQAIDFIRVQGDALRDHIRAEQWITTNIIPTYWEIDFHKLGKVLNFVSWDCYTVIDANSPVRKPDVGPSPPIAFPPRSSMISFVHDMMRSCSKQPFMVMETAGQDRLVSFHTMAHGGTGVNFFRWRSVRFGAEQGRGGYEYHGIFSERFHESQKISRELHTVSDVVSRTEFAGQVGLLYSFDMGWAYDIHHVYPRSQWLDAVGYWRLLEEYYTAFWKHNIPVQPINIGDDLAGLASQYPVIIVPCLYLTTPEINHKLSEYVRHGGTVIVGPASGTKNWHNAYIDNLPPDPELKTLFGCEYVGSGSIGYFGVQANVTLSDDAPFAAGETFACKVQSTDKIGFFSASRPVELLRPTTASVIAYYDNQQAACAVNQFGEGQVITLGFSPDEGFMDALIAHLESQHKLHALMQTPEGVEVTRRTGAGYDLRFVVNHNFVPTAVHLDAPYTDMLSDKLLAGEVLIPPQHTLILQVTKGGD